MCISLIKKSLFLLKNFFYLHKHVVYYKYFSKLKIIIILKASFDNIYNVHLNVSKKYNKSKYKKDYIKHLQQNNKNKYFILEYS
jgi:hypothetical protein